MKKNYLKPELEVISFFTESRLMDTSTNIGGETDEWGSNKKDEDRSYGKKIWD